VALDAGPSHSEQELVVDHAWISLSAGGDGKGPIAHRLGGGGGLGRLGGTQLDQQHSHGKGGDDGEALHGCSLPASR
jgi:hypothetical protein